MADTGSDARERQRVKKLEKTVDDLTDVVGHVFGGLRAAGVSFSLPQRLRKYASVGKSGAASSATANLSFGKERYRVKPGGPEKAATPPRAEVGSKELVKATGLAGAVARGEAARVEWVNSGEIVPASALSAAWGITSQALGPAAQRGDLFAVVVRNMRYYPREFLELDRKDVADICQLLKELDPAEQLVFWKRKHAQLGGRTVLEALTAQPSQMAKALKLAESQTAQMHAAAKA